MRTLVITDLHLNCRVPGLLGAQQECVKRIVREERPDEVIIMGDVFTHRKPSPSALIAFKKILQFINYSCDTCIPVTVLRGNHDSENKSDDGITALSIFNYPGVNIITHSELDHKNKRAYIPHYENEKTIIEYLETVPTDYQIFGHFGYDGCLNSVGDADFALGLSNFRSDTLLGHIHDYSKRRGGTKENPTSVVCLGTPYTTNYGEAFKENFYAILEDGEIEYKKVTHGPRHLVYNADNIKSNLTTINDLEYFTFLRIIIGEDHSEIPLDDIKVAYVDIKYAPVFDEEQVSNYAPERDLFSINDVIIEDYVKQAITTLSVEKIMEGYRLLQDEN